MREWVTHLGGRARGGGFAEITRKGGASGEFDGLRRRGNDGHIFFSSVVPLEGRDRPTQRTRADPDRSTIVHRDRSIDRSIAMRVWIASHRIASSPSTRATTKTRRGDARDDKKGAESARDSRRADARTHLHGGGHDDVCMSAGRARARRGWMRCGARSFVRFRRTRGCSSCEELQYGCVVDVHTVTVGWGRFMGERGCGIRAWEWMTKKESA